MVLIYNKINRSQEYKNSITNTLDKKCSQFVMTYLATSYRQNKRFSFFYLERDKIRATYDISLVYKIYTTEKSKSTCNNSLYLAQLQRKYNP